MKMKLIFLIIACCLFGTIFQLHSQGYIVANGVTTDGYLSGLGYDINVVHNPTTAPSGGSTTGFFLNPVSSNTFQFNPIVDIGVRVFFVSPNDPITANTILSGNYTELANAPTYVFDDGSPFYVGLYTGNQSFAPPNGIYTDPLFGWAELENVGGAIELLNSALEYQGGGIYAGTQTIIPVPEPREFALIALGALLLGYSRRSK